MLGFPIRTPPDHSLVANSPGLIAGSNVLHRLLMPRHPPCALHSLSQQRQNNTRRNTCRSNTIDHKPKNTRPAPQSKEQAGTDSHSPPPARNRRQQERSITHSQPEPTATSTNQGNDRLVVKMLASTMQISNNNPTNPLTPPHRRSSDEERNQKPQPRHQPPTQTNKRERRHRRLILQDPTVCSTIPPPT